MVKIQFISILLFIILFKFFCVFSVPRFKQRLSFILPEYGNLYDVLDAAKVADSVMLVVDDQGVDHYGDYCLSCLFAQGFPAPVVTFQVCFLYETQQLVLQLINISASDCFNYFYIDVIPLCFPTLGFDSQHS